MLAFSACCSMPFHAPSCLAGCLHFLPTVHCPLPTAVSSPSPAVRPRLPLVLRAAFGEPLLPTTELGAVTRVPARGERERVGQSAEEIDKGVVRQRTVHEPSR